MKLISVPTKEEISFFASSLATIQNSMLNDLAKESSDPANVKLEKVAKVYENAAQSVYDLSVPIDIASYDLDIVNNYSIVASSYTDLNNADSDPVMATIALKYFQDAEKSQRGDVEAMANYFQDNGIIFSSDEAGSYWNQFVTSPTNTTNTSTPLN